MTRFGKLSLAFGLVVLMSVPALAQGQGRGGFGRGMGGGGLLTNKSVQAEIKVTEEQASKLATFAEEFGAKQREAFQGFQDMSQEERQAKMREMQASMTKGLGEILKPEQLKRFQEIQLQQMGLMGLSNGPAAEKIKLTDEQKEKLRDIQQEMMQSMGDLREQFQNDREGAMKKMTEIRKETLAKGLKVLTDEQQKTYKELTGKPFEVKFEPRPN